MSFLKKQNAVSALVAAAVLLISTAVFAETVKPTVRSDLKKTPGSVNVQPGMVAKAKTDMVVESINNSVHVCACSDSLEPLGVMLFDSLWVTLGNWPCDDGSKANATGQLKVTYYDVAAGNQVTRNVAFSLNGNSRQAIKIQDGPILIKQSPGVSATITDISVEDCDTANNTKTIKECVGPPIY